MEKKLITEINIEDKEITHFASFSLKQAFNEHHYFELRFNLVKNEEKANMSELLNQSQR